MLTVGKLYRLLTVKGTSYTGPAVKCKRDFPFWAVGDTSQSLVKRPPDGSVVMCVEYFITDKEYLYPNEMLGVFLFGDKLHLLYEIEVKETD